MKNNNSEKAEKTGEFKNAEFKKNSAFAYEEIEKDFNSKILKITLEINDKYPELSKYLEEMPVTIPDETKPDVTIKKLQAYYESLNSIVTKYILEHSDNKKESKK